MTRKAAEHLWQAKHRYYCAQNNYFSNECTKDYESWAEFLEEEGDADPDYNLLFRWDWRDANNKDEELEQDELELFWIGQRKGLFRSTIVKVKKSDEAAVRKWLKPRLKHLVSLWEPLTGDISAVTCKRCLQKRKGKKK